jgi:hypothetical protein
VTPLPPGTVVRDSHGDEWTVRRSNRIAGHWVDANRKPFDGPLVYVLHASRGRDEYLSRYPASEVESWEIVSTGST